LREWVRNNSALVTVTSFTIAAAVFSRGLGRGKSAAWLESCFILLALLLMQETFETFPPPGRDSAKLLAFKWVFASTMATLSFYWMLVAYRASGTWMLGFVSVLLGFALGEWVVRSMPFFVRHKTRWRQFLRGAVVFGLGVLASMGANYAVPRLAPTIERDFVGAMDTAVIPRQAPSLETAAVLRSSPDSARGLVRGLAPGVRDSAARGAKKPE
jgi:hypothetical protein